MKTPNGITLEGEIITKKILIKEYRLVYLKLQRFLIKEFQIIKDPKIKEIIEKVGKIYKRVKILNEIPF